MYKPFITIVNSFVDMFPVMYTFGFRQPDQTGCPGCRGLHSIQFLWVMMARDVIRDEILPAFARTERRRVETMIELII